MMVTRHAVVVASSAGRATVTLDGADISVPVNSSATLTVGATAVLLQEGRVVVALGEIAP